jgi:hypothetical protein
MTGAILFLLIALISLHFLNRKGNKRFVNFSTTLSVFTIFFLTAVSIPANFSSPERPSQRRLLWAAHLKPTVLSHFKTISKIPSIYYQKIQNTPLFPGVDTLALGQLSGYGKVLGVWRHSMKHAYFYLYLIKKRKLVAAGKPYLLPPDSQPFFAFVNRKLWICLGQTKISNLVLNRSHWKVRRQFNTGHRVMGLTNFHRNILLALEKKPGWSSLFLYSSSGKRLWEEKREWNSRSYGFAASGKNLWVSVNHWDGLTTRILHFYFMSKQKIDLFSEQQTNTLSTGKIILAGAGIIHHHPYIAATVWGFTTFGLLARQVLFSGSSKNLTRIKMVFPFPSSFLASILKIHHELVFAEEFHPTREIVLPDSISVWGIKQIPRLNSTISLGFDPKGIKKFTNQTLPKPKSIPRKPFNPNPYRAKLLPWQWKAWKKLMAETGQDGIAGVSGPDYPLAHGWDAIADPNPEHTVWANNATPRDYLTGKVKGTVWPYIPFDTHPRVILCERCHPLRKGVYPFWCMYNTLIKGNKLTPDGMRVPPR